MTSAEPGTTVLRPPLPRDGAAMWRVARDSRTLDLNSPYAYLLWARDFADTSLVAEVGGVLAGFVTGFLRPAAPSSVMVWQLAVGDTHRGRGLAGRLLDELARRTGAHALETTITADNAASLRTFGSFAHRHRAEHHVSELFTVDHFPPGHDGKPEQLHRIAPLHTAPGPDPTRRTPP